MSHLNRRLKAAAGDVADVAEDSSQSVDLVAHAVVDTARAAGHRVAQTAGHVVEAVEEKGEQLGHAVRDTVTHGRDRVVRWEHKFEGAIRARPIVSLLIAAGVGAVAGAVGARLFRRRG